MDRRGFLKFLGAGVAGVALAEAIPLGRVWSFPSQIVVPGTLILPPGSQVRFFRAWDPWDRLPIARLDVLMGFGTVHPAAIAYANGWCENNESDADKTIVLPKSIPLPAIEVMQDEVNERRREQTAAQYFGVNMNPSALRKSKWTDEASFDS